MYQFQIKLLYLIKYIRTQQLACTFEDGEMQLTLQYIEGFPVRARGFFKATTAGSCSSALDRYYQLIIHTRYCRYKQTD